MKTLIIPDIHGRNSWKEVVENTTYDKIIFLGDYVDSFNISDVEILANLQEIITFAKLRENMVTLLLGNHDWQYLFRHEEFRCSGFRPSMAWQLHYQFKENLDLFKIACRVDDKTIASHAGICHSWAAKFIDKFKDIVVVDIGNLVEILNGVITNGTMNMLKSIATVGMKRGGFEAVGGPIWADKKELTQDYLIGYNQIVGHTVVGPEPVIVDALESKKLYFLDTGDHPLKPFIWES